MKNLRIFLIILIVSCLLQPSVMVSNKWAGGSPKHPETIPFSPGRFSSKMPHFAFTTCSTAPAPCVQNVSFSVPSPYTATSVNQSFTSTPGHTHVLGVSACGDSGCGTGSVAGATVTVSDGVNTYTQIEHVDSITGFGGWLFYAHNVSGGTVTVTLSISGVSTPYYLNAELSEWDFAASPLDTHANASDPSVGPGTTTAVTVTTTNANETILAFAVATAGGARTAGSGFTFVDNTAEAVEEEFKASPGSYVAEVDKANVAAWLILGASFNPSGGGGGGLTPAQKAKGFFILP